MEFVTKQNFKIQELVELPRSGFQALLIFNDIPLREIYIQHFKNKNFQAIAFSFGEFHTILEYLEKVKLVILELTSGEEQDKLRFLQTTVEKFPDLTFITVGNSLEKEILNEFMQLGAVGHIDRKFTRPEDLADLASMLIDESKFTVIT